jgi:hypothetical protein
VTASRVSLAAMVRLRRAVDFDGDLAAVERRVAARLRDGLGLRAVVGRFAAGVGVVSVVVVVSAMW